MNYSKKQKIFTIFGLSIIFLTPFIIFFGSLPLANLFCAENDNLQNVCIGLAVPMSWGILILGPLLLGTALILIGSFTKKK